MVFLHKAYFNSTREVNTFNLTLDVARALRESKVVDGIITVMLPSGGAGVVILENDPAIRTAFLETLDGFVPPLDSEVRPQRRSGTGGSRVHVLGALVGNSVSIPVKEGRLLMESWQEVIVFDFDDKVGRREVIVHVLGDGGGAPQGQAPARR